MRSHQHLNNISSLQREQQNNPVAIPGPVCLKGQEGKNSWHPGYEFRVHLLVEHFYLRNIVA
jgi:hypothetical protein